MARPVEIARRAVAAAASSVGTARIKSDAPFIIEPDDLFERTLTQVGISDEPTISVFRDHLQIHIQKHLPSAELGHLELTGDTRFRHVADKVTELLLAGIGTHGTDEPPDESIEMYEAGTHGSDYPPDDENQGTI